MSMVVDVPAMADAEVRFRRDVGDEVVCGLDRLPIDDVLAGCPVRDFRWYKGRRFYSGWYWAAATGGLVAYESRLELARILLADFDPTVTGIAAQPFQLVGRDGDVLRRHVPDLLLRHTSGEVVVVDVKPAHRVGDPAVAAVFEWTARMLASRGWRLEVWSGAAEPLLANMALVTPPTRGTQAHLHITLTDIQRSTPIMQNIHDRRLPPQHARHAVRASSRQETKNLVLVLYGNNPRLPNARPPGSS